MNESSSEKSLIEKTPEGVFIYALQPQCRLQIVSPRKGGSVVRIRNASFLSEFPKCVDLTKATISFWGREPISVRPQNGHNLRKISPLVRRNRLGPFFPFG